MIRLAHVLIVDAGRSRAETLQARLTKAGYSVAILATAAEGEAAIVADHPDLVLIGEVERPVALAATIKHGTATADIPVLLLADRLTAELCAEVLECGCDGILTSDCGDDELLARIRPLGRLATMHAELRLRARIAQRAGITARDRVIVGGAGRPAILVAGDQVDAIRTALGDDVELAFAETLTEAEDALTRRNFDAAVVTFSALPDSVLGFCAQVRHNPRLFNLPIVLLAGGDPADAYRAGATRVLAPPQAPQVLRTAVLTLVRRQQLRWSIREALADSLAEPTRDAETGAYGRDFFAAYLAERLSFATASGRHLAVAFFAAPNIDDVRRQFGDDAALHLTQQFGQWIAGLLRVEDLVARTGRHEFAVVLPDTPLAEAETVIHRIAGVLTYTDFAVREVYQPVKLWVQVGATDAQADDDLATLLARARRNLD